jgi:ABC-type transport system involved in multi-copper enzyme maturation permease subunit
MIWLSWRQFRVQAIVAGAALVVVAIALVSTGPHLASLFDSNGLATCRTTCATDANNFIDQVKGSATELIFYGCTFLLYAVPALIGIFWGAPLVARELESGTFRLAWNQSVPRARWIAVKLGLVGLAAMASTGLLSLMTSWWASPIYHAAQKAGGNSLSISKITPPLFGATGIAPVGYAAFAFALGVTAGVVIRRTIPAMAVTLVIFAAVQVVMPLLIQPHLISPVQLTAPFNPNTANEIMVDSQGSGPPTMTLEGNFSKPGAWIVSNQTITPSGKVFTGPPASACTSNSAPPQACNNWLNSQHLRQLISYQPASRYWPMQWLELAIYLVLATGLGVLCVWQVRRRRG